MHAQSCLPHLCDPMDCNPPGSSVHGVLQARILEWVAISSSRGSYLPRDQTHVSYIFLTLVPWALRISAAIPVVKTTGPTPYSSEIIVHSIRKMSQTLGLNQGQFCCPGDIWQRKPGNILEGFPGGSLVKNPPANEGDTGDVGSIPGSGKSPGGGNGNPLQ